MGIIFDIQRCCYHDGPGIRTTVFLKGCNLNCAWCHNPESFSIKPQLHYGEEKSASEVLKVILKDKAYYDESGGGVTFSGGEPTMQPKFLLELLQLSKEHGLHTCLETNGYVPLETLQKITPYVDMFLLDYKVTDEDDLKKYTGARDGLWSSTIEYLEQMGKPVILRMPIIPGINDNEAHFAKAKSLKGEYSVIQKLEIMPYHSIGADKWNQLGLTYTLSHLDSASPEQKAYWQSLVSD